MSLEMKSKMIAALVQAKLAALSMNKLGPAATSQDYMDFDGGSCNFDSPVLKIAGFSKQDLQEVSKASGVEIGDKLSSRMWKGYAFVQVPLYGQAMNRTRMAEAAQDELEKWGLESAMYYQMD